MNPRAKQKPHACLPITFILAIALGMGTAAEAQKNGKGGGSVTPSLPAVGLVVHEMDDVTIHLLKEAGVTHVRTTLYWELWEHVDPTARASYRADFAAGMDRFRRAGMELLVVVHSTPPWATYETRDRVYREFANFMRDRAVQFPWVRGWQLWNEQDAGWTSIFGWGVVPLSEQGRNYAAMLRRAYPAIKEVSPSAVVVVGGLVGYADSQEFLQGVYAGGGRGRLDVVAVHAYGPPPWIAARDQGDGIRAVMRRNNDRSPMWLTEFGLDDASMIRAWNITQPQEWDAVQADEWRKLVEWNDQSAMYARLVGYVLYDVSDYGHGIVRTDRTSVRPAYQWLKNRNVR